MSSQAFETEPAMPNLPLEERCLAFINEKETFTFNDLKRTFPTEADKNLYRAINRLENEGRIKFLYYRNKRKHYTTAGASNLPNLKNQAGQTASLAELFKIIQTMYGTGHYQMAQSLDDLPLNYCRLFVVAQIEDLSERKRAFLELHRELMIQRETLSTMLANLDQVIRHPTLSGDMEYFREIFTGREAPNPQELNEFKVWYRKFQEAKKNV